MTLTINRFFAILIIFQCIGSFLKAQTPDSLSLNQIVSGVQLYEANKSITLQTGFNYTASGSNQMMAKIVSTASNSNYLFTDQIENSSLNIDTTFHVGSINGSATVGSSGAASYTIPIDFPPGRSGIKPQLAIGYNSKAGEDLLGLGWYLAGFSSITRTSTNFYHDGFIDEIDFDNNDKFALDGQRLINIGEDQYRTEIESFQKITMYGPTSNPTYFKVETKDGMELFYGNTSDSKVEAQDTTVAYKWNLNRVNDKFGNYYSITYTETQSTGEIYPNNITYTGYSSNAGDYTIEFLYENRVVPITTYIYGFQIMIGKMLKFINIKYLTTTVGKYEMIYTNSYLTEIIKYGLNNSQLNPTVIKWGIPNNVYAESERDRLGRLNYWYQGDFNGDGRTDMFIEKDTLMDSGDLEKAASGIESVNSFLDEPTLYHWGDLYLADTSGTLVFNTGRFAALTQKYIGDYNGDGLDEILSISYLGSSCYLTFNLFGANPGWPGVSIPIDGTASSYFIGDFNGNGKSDLLIHVTGGSHNCLIYEFTFASGGIVSSTLIGETNIYWGNIGFTEIKETILDINGNGKTDIIVIDSIGTRFFELYESTMYMVELCRMDFPTNRSNGILFGDFNGDGMTDIFSFDNPNFWRISISKGNGFTQPTISNFNQFIQTSEYNNFYANDMNGDGKCDIVAIGRGSSGFNPVKLYVGFSDGQNFTLQTYTPDSPTNIQISPLYNHFGDFNGDGVSDFYYEDESNAWLINTHRGKSQYLVSEIKNGFGYSTKFNYGSLSYDSFYTKDTCSTFPVLSYQSPIYNVSSIEFENPDHSFNTIDYSYFGAHVHLQGKGFLGFRKVTSNSNIINLQSIEEYDYNPTYFNSYIVKSKVNHLTDSVTITPISEASYNNAVTVISGKRIFPYLDGSTQKNYLSGDSIAQDLNFDSNGNLIFQKETFGDGSFNSLTYSNFSNNGTWIPSKPQIVVLSKKHYQDTQTFDLTTTYTYETTSGKLKTQSIGPVITTYSYNTYGNPVSVKVNDGITSRRDSFVYDTTNMFVEKSLNALNHTTLRTYDYYTGNVMQETSPITNLIREYTYDDFGVLTNSTVNALGQNQTITYKWATGSRPTGSVYYKKVVTDGAPTIIEYYNAFGRAIKVQKIGFDGSYIYSGNRYNEKGQLIEASTPWKEGETPLKTVFTYDNYGRKINESSDVGSVSYTYSGNTVTASSSGGQTSSKTMDSQGNVISSTDIGGTVSFTYKSNGNPGSTSNNGSTWNMTYDTYGRQISLTDPNAGTTTYRYNMFGELTRQLDAKGNIDSLTYDVLGRVATEVRKEGTNPYESKSYSYDSTGIPGLLWKVEYAGGKEYYNYDTKGRLTSDSVSIDGTYYSTRYGYDSKSRIQRLTYPSGFAVKYAYTTFGYLNEVRRIDNDSLIWDATTMNSFGQYTEYNSGNGLTTTKAFDCLGMLQSIRTGSIQNLGYSFDEVTGNLISRKDNINNLTEIFSYDNLGRLTEVSGPSPITMNYTNNGNIINKTSVGDYSYGTKPHAVTSVTNPNGLISSTDQRITYTVFNKADSIIQNNYKYVLTYGHQNQRTRSKLMDGNGTLLKTTYYVGAYEKEVTPGDPYQKDIHYIYGGDGLAAIYTRHNSSQIMYYVHKDHLGSLDKLTSSAGVVVQKTSFDAWGRRRNPDNWTYSNIPATIFSRGYTGHEHLDQFDLINMNGRMYDPLLGRFLSVDPFVADPFNTQEYNRYSYVMNNPLKYIDPSGFTYKQFMDKHYGEGNYYYRGDSLGSWGGGGGSSGGSRYTYDPKSPTGYRDDHGNYVTWEEVQANLPTNLQQISPSNFNLVLNGGFAYQGRASVVYGNAYAPDPNGLYDIYMYFDIEPYCVAQSGGSDSWAVTATAGYMVALQVDLVTPDPTDAVWIKWVGHGVLGITSAVILYSAGKRILNPNLEGTTTSRGNPTDWSFDPEINMLQNDNYFPPGSNPPGWFWFFLGAAGAYELYQNWPKPNIPQPTNPVNNTYIVPARPTNPYPYGY